MTVRRLGPTALAVLALTLLGAALRFATLDLRGFWTDETATIFVVRHEFFEVFGEVAGQEATPPLYYVIAWFWTRLFGDGEVGIRSLSALVGTATIPVAYLAARELFARRVALAAAAVLAVSPILIWYSQEGRSYALLVLLTVTSFLFFARALRRETTPAFALWAAFSALAVATHYFAAFVFFPQAVWLLAGRRRRAALSASAVVCAIGVALLPLMAAQKDERVAWAAEVDLFTRSRRIIRELLVGYETPSVVAAFPLGLALVGGLIVLARGTSVERRGALVAASVAGGAVAVPLGLALAGVDYVAQRNLIGAFFPAALVCAAGFGAQRARRLGPAAAVALCAISAACVLATADVPKYGTQDWRRAASALEGAPHDRAIVATPAGEAEKPLFIYVSRLRDLPQSGALVREVVLLGMAAEATGSDPHPPRPPTPAPPARGLKLIERTETRTFTLIRFAAARPVLVRPSSLRSLALDPLDPVVLLQPARSSRRPAS